MRARLQKVEQEMAGSSFGTSSTLAQRASARCRAVARRAKRCETPSAAPARRVRARAFCDSEGMLVRICIRIRMQTRKALRTLSRVVDDSNAVKRSR